MEETMNTNKEIFGSDEVLEVNELTINEKLKTLFPKQVTILGTCYTIEVKDYNDDPWFKDRRADGYCSGAEKRIVICNEATYPDQNGESETYYRNIMKHTLRHEIVHAFLNESGLIECTCSSRGGWAKNEEMIDWIAAMGERIQMAWLHAGCSSLPVFDKVNALEYLMPQSTKPQTKQAL